MGLDTLNTNLSEVARRVPMTRLGLVVLVGTYLSYTYWGRGASDFVVVSATIGVGSIFCLSFISVGIAALSLKRRLDETEDENRVASVQVGTTLTDGFRFHRFRYWPVVQSSVTWVNPSTVNVALIADGPYWREAVQPRTRGRWQSIHRRFQVTDLFGLVRWSIDDVRTARIRVAPRAMTVDLKVTFLDGAEDGYAHPHGAPIGDFIELRRYSPGDPLKNVLWKAYARTGKLFVRTPENALDVLPSTAAYFVAGSGDEASASVTRALLQERLLGDELLFAADGREDVAQTADTALDLVIDSAHNEGIGGDGLLAFEKRMRRDRIDRCLLIVPNQEGPWMPAVAQFMAKAKFPPLVISALDKLPEPRQTRLPSWLFKAPETEGAAAQTIGAVARGMHSLGCELRVVDGRSGKVLSPSQLQALEQA